MNVFEQAYLNIINQWNNNLLLEANLKSLIPNIQQQLIGNKSYNDLTEQEKENLQNNINKQLNEIETKVNQITDNKQYQSWIYNVLKNKEVPINDLNPLKSLILDFEKLSKRPDLKTNQKNIQNYSTLNSLKEFIDSFKEEHNLSSNIYKNLKKIYSNDKFTVYFINKDQYKECNKLFGTTDYFSTGWCIAKNKQYFDQYIEEEPDQYNGYFVFIKDNKPYALLHYGSYQFKNTSDDTLEINNLNIIDCLYHINNNLDDYKYNDLIYYKKLIEKQIKEKWKKLHPNASKEDWIAFEIGGEYDYKTKTIDCKGNKVYFKDEWLNENGTFDFTFINATDDWSYMFYTCDNLKELPANFTIPNSVKYCIGMFGGCENLKELPNNFTIPNNIKSCYGMFDGCENLIKLPDNFSIPNNITNCRYIFSHCENLTKLPEKFSIPDSVKDCSYMFTECTNLTKLPDNFSIPNSVKYCLHMFGGCMNLTKLPDNFSIPKNSKYDSIFDESGLEGKYKPENLLK